MSFDKQGVLQPISPLSQKVYVERELSFDSFSLRAQFDWRVARLQAEMEVDRLRNDEVAQFRAPAEQVFTREKMIEFLIHLRKKAAVRVGTRHASTPQVVVFHRGLCRWVEQDAAIAPWRYFHTIGPRAAPTSVKVMIATRHTIVRSLPWLYQTRITETLLESNELLIYPSTAGQSMLNQTDSIRLDSQMVVLTGWLW